MSNYVSMHNADRLTKRQLEGLLTVLEMGLADAEALLNDGPNGLVSDDEHTAAQQARDKLYSALFRHRDKKGS